MTRTDHATQTVATLISQAINRTRIGDAFADPGDRPGTVVVELDGRRFRVTVEAMQ